MPKKVFEIAKEAGVSSLDLVELLKSNGVEVRNHMSSLSDEEVEKALALLSPAEPVEATKKKKTAKRKTAKKATEGTKKKAKATTVKRKTVIRRKSGTSAADEVEEEVVEAAPETKKKVVKKATKKKVAVEEKVEEELVEETGTGLRVVARPEVKKEVVETMPEEPEETVEEVYKEKVHTFTPVYIPPKEEIESRAKAKEKEAAEQKRYTEEETTSVDEDSDRKKDSTSKKRLGGLASMMSGKKQPVSKAEALNQARAESELKSYAALSSLGRPIYTPVKKKKQYSGPSEKTQITEVKESKRVVNVHGAITAADLALKLSQKFRAMADRCLEINLLVKESDYLGPALAEEIAAIYDYRVENVAFNEDEIIGKKDLSEEEKSNLPPRNPIITIMGHVDHGKTTLLDYIRNAKVAAGEAGGITQHIGAYSVKVKGQTLTFLDTPGHAAFASMRQRGADVTDIVILVVAADDGMMPQTKESVKFCQNSNKPIIVAVNKCDKEQANPDKVKTELAEVNITPEDWGGDTQFCNISALKGDGVDELLEAVALQAEMLDLRAEPKGPAEGVVIESKIEQGRGPMATILVQSGTLNKGDSIVVGETFGRARSLMDSFGKQLKSAGPSTPVQILGLADAPSPGDTMNVVKSEREAKKIVANRQDERKQIESAPEKAKVSLEDFFASAPVDDTEKKCLKLIVRADVQGSFEAIKQSLHALANPEVDVQVISGGVGAITDSDVNLAAEAQGFIIGFNMRPVTTARRLAEDKGVDVKTYSIIYELINDVKLAIEGLLEPDYVEQFIGRAEVRDTFTVPKIGTIAGCYVIDGKIEVQCHIRLLRSGKILHDGKLSSLKRFKDDVKEVKQGYECGMGLENYNDVKVGDLFEAYLMVEKKRSLEDVVSEHARKEGHEENQPGL